EERADTSERPSAVGNAERSSAVTDEESPFRPKDPDPRCAQDDRALGGGSTTTRRLPGTTFPIAKKRWPAFVQMFAACATFDGDPKTNIPIPILKTRCISSNETWPSRARISKIGGTDQAPDRMTTPTPSGRTRGMLS